MIAPPETWELRAPFADEEDRLRRHFTPIRTPQHRPAPWRRIISAGRRQRIVGLAELFSSENHASDDVPGGLRLNFSCSLRPAWQQTDAARSLVEAALARARELGAREVDFLADPGTPLARVALASGFEELLRRERWRVPVAGPLAWMRIRGDRLLEKAPPIVSTQATPLEWIRDLCLATGLLRAEQVARHVPGMSHGFDDRFSFASSGSGRLDAALLAREQFGKLYLEILARHPLAKDAPRITVIALIREFFRQAAAQGYEEVFCEIRPGKTPGLLKALIIGQGTLHSALGSYRKRL